MGLACARRGDRGARHTGTRVCARSWRVRDRPGKVVPIMCIMRRDCMGLVQISKAGIDIFISETLGTLSTMTGRLVL